MLPPAEAFTLPLKEGIREVRFTIRQEARSGELSTLLLGRPGPSREIARLVDGALTRAQGVARRVLRRSGDADLGQVLDRLAAGLTRPGDVRDGARDQYRLYRAILQRLDQPAIISEMRLADGLRATRRGPGADPVVAAVRQAIQLASLHPVRPQAGAEGGPSGDAIPLAALNGVVALIAGLSVLVRRETGENADSIVDSVRWVVDAESEAWLALADARAEAALAKEWRRVVSYLP